MKKNLLILLIFPLIVFADFGTGTEKAIDTIINNTGTDITLNPTNKVVIPYLNDGDVTYYDSGITGLAIGTEDQILSVSSGGFPEWIDFVPSPLTTKGDIYTYDTDVQRLAVGTDAQLLSADSAEATGLKWIDPPSTTPTTTEGDLILRGATEDERLAIGGVDQLLTSDGTTASWEDAPISTTLTTKGDIQGFDTANARVAVGADGEFLVADSAESLGVKWTDTLSGTLNPVTDWESNTCTSAWVSGATMVCNTKRVGDSLEMEGKITLTGTPTTANLFLNLPNSLVMDSAKMQAHGDNRFIGTVQTRDSSAFQSFYGSVAWHTSTAVILYVFLDQGTYEKAQVLSATTPFTYASGDAVYFKFSVPIVGWSSGTSAAVTGTQLEMPNTTDWVASTGTLSDNTNNSALFFERRVGDSLHYKGEITWTGAGAGGAFSVTIPGGYTVDTAKMISVDVLSEAGHGGWYDSSALQAYSLLPFINTSTSIRFGESATANALWDGTQAASGDTVSFEVILPIVGWNATDPVSAVIAGTFEENASKCQTKYLSSNITSTTPDVTDLKFTALDTSKYYKVTMQNTMVPLSSSNCKATYSDGTNLILLNQMQLDISGPEDRSATTAHNPFFKPASSTLTATFTENADCRFEGNGTSSGTWTTLCELPLSTTITTEW